MMEIGFDLDGCVIRFDKTYDKMVFRDYGIRIPLDDIQDYGSIRTYVKHLTDDEYLKLIDRTIIEGAHNPEMIMPAYEGSIEFIKQYHDDGHKIVFITARNFTHQAVLTATRKWLNDYFKPNYPFKLIYAENKTVPFIANGLKWAIEDAPKYAIQLAESGIKVMLITRNWNKNFDISPYPNIRRVKDWTDIQYIYKNVTEYSSYLECMGY